MSAGTRRKEDRTKNTKNVISDQRWPRAQKCLAYTLRIPSYIPEFTGRSKPTPESSFDPICVMSCEYLHVLTYREIINKRENNFYFMGNADIK